MDRQFVIFHATGGCMKTSFPPEYSKIAGFLHSAMLVIARMYTECGFLDSQEAAVIIMIRVFWDMTPCSFTKYLLMFRNKSCCTYLTKEALRYLRNIDKHQINAFITQKSSPIPTHCCYIDCHIFWFTRTKCKTITTKMSELKGYSVGFWRRCITHRINGFSDFFVHRPDSKEL
jgi:hypothetical protein